MLAAPLNELLLSSSDTRRVAAVLAADRCAADGADAPPLVVLPSACPSTSRSPLPTGAFAAPSAPLAGALPLTALRSWPSLSSRSTCRLAAEIAAYRRCVRHLHHALARSTSLPSRSRRCAALVRREHRQSCLHCRRWLRCRTCSCCWRAVKVLRVRTRSLPCHHELEFDVERGVHRRRRRHRRESEAAPRVHASSVSRLRG